MVSDPLPLRLSYLKISGPERGSKGQHHCSEEYLHISCTCGFIYRTPEVPGAGQAQWISSGRGSCDCQETHSEACAILAVTGGPAGKTQELLQAQSSTQ